MFIIWKSFDHIRQLLELFLQCSTHWPDCHSNACCNKMPHDLLGRDCTIQSCPTSTWRLMNSRFPKWPWTLLHLPMGRGQAASSLIRRRWGPTWWNALKQSLYTAPVICLRRLGVKWSSVQSVNIGFIWLCMSMWTVVLSQCERILHAICNVFIISDVILEHIVQILQTTITYTFCVHLCRGTQFFTLI